MDKEENYSKKYNVVKRITLSTLFCNFLLAFGKLFGGIFGFSKALISDSINSFGDIITSFITLLGAKISSKKPDKGHPYGHERVESIAILIFEMIVIFSGLIIGYNAIISIINHNEVELPDIISLIVAAICVGVKFILFIVAFTFYKKTKSAILKAQMLDHLLDSIGTFVSLIGIIIAINFGIWWLDSAISLLICCLIIFTAVKVMFENITCLIDQSWGEENEKAIIEVVNKYPEVKKVDFIKTRKFGEKVYVDLEISMDSNMTLLDSHGIADKIEKEIEESCLEVIHVAIHVNPIV